MLADPFFGGVVNGTTPVSAATRLAELSRFYTLKPSIRRWLATRERRTFAKPNAVFAKKTGLPPTISPPHSRSALTRIALATDPPDFSSAEAAPAQSFVLITDASSTAATGACSSATTPHLRPPHTSPIMCTSTPFGVDVDNSNYEVILAEHNGWHALSALNRVGSGRSLHLSRRRLRQRRRRPDLHLRHDDGLAWRRGQDRQHHRGGRRLHRSTLGRRLGKLGDEHGWIPNMIPNVPTANAPVAVFGSRITTPQTVVTEHHANRQRPCASTTQQVCRRRRRISRPKGEYDRRNGEPNGERRQPALTNCKLQ